ncbi:MAG: toll/interleukin-1 receptor domain-containing protein [Phyllobacteriaceae bacterium]|nr:toll/interleukin-1 receptor domain-containing protein [Phyllobacteriaceae bacterium]
MFGTPSFGLPREMADELDRRIALGGGRKDFWDRPAEAINGEIAGWVEEARRRARPVFISYNSADLDAAKQIGGVIDEGGYSVFAQYKDMPPGSNFIAEMQRGLENMGKFSPIYSPDYIASDICQDEWNAAYNMDRGGRRRLIVGFLVRPTVLKPLQKQICYVPLYAVPEDKARQAILDALAADGTKHSPERSRGEAREAASPDPVIHDGRIDVNAESPIEQPFIDDELAHLPEEMRKLLRLIIASMSTANAPIMAREAATDYRDELITNGARPHMPDLIRCAEFIQADIEIAVQFDASWYAGGLKKALEEFSRLHEKLRQRFPLVMLRDHAIENSSIDSASFDKPEFSSSHKQLANASGKAEDDGKASEEFRRVMERRERQRQDIESLREPAKPVDGELIPADKDRVSPANLKKRFLFDVSGTADRLLERVAKVTDIADSEAGKAIIKASKEMLKAIWGG